MNIKQLSLVTMFVCTTGLSATTKGQIFYYSPRTAEFMEQLEKEKNVPYEGKIYTLKTKRQKHPFDANEKSTEYELQSPVTIFNIVDIGEDGIVITDEPTQKPPYITIQTTPRIYYKDNIIAGMGIILGILVIIDPRNWTH